MAKALSDPIRLRMLERDVPGTWLLRLSAAGCPRGVPGTGDPEGICVCEFQEQFGLGQSQASYHLRVLRDAGLVPSARGKWAFYAIDREAVAAAWCDLHALLRI